MLKDRLIVHKRLMKNFQEVIQTNLPNCHTFILMTILFQENNSEMDKQPCKINTTCM